MSFRFNGKKKQFDTVIANVFQNEYKNRNLPVAKMTTVNGCVVPSMNSAPSAVNRLTLSFRIVPAGSDFLRFSRASFVWCGGLFWLSVTLFATFDRWFTKSNPDALAPMTITCSPLWAWVGEWFAYFVNNKNELKWFIHNTFEFIGRTIIMTV